MSLQEKKDSNIPRKYRRIMFACSKAIGYVVLKNVVHSIDRRRNNSASDSAGCDTVNDGSVPTSSGSALNQSTIR